MNLVSQLRRLVYEPFKAACKRGRLLKTYLLKGPFLIVIDGLDECEDRGGVEAFIDDMLEFFRKNPLVPLRLLITSRIEHHIQGRLENDQVRLMNLVDHCSRDDVDTFLAICFEEETKRNLVVRAFVRDHGDWPTKVDKDQLVDHIGSSFLLASTLLKYIFEPTNNAPRPTNPTIDASTATDPIKDALTPMDRLPHTLKMNPCLDTLYSQTLARSQHLPRFSAIISTIALLPKPLSIVGLAELLGIESFEVVQVLVNLQAIIHIPGTDEQPVTFCYTSLRDFLEDESRSGDFFASPYHLHLAYRCYKLKDSGTAAASYYIGRWGEHLQEFLNLPPRVQGLFPGFPETLDALYSLILARSQDLPHFSDVISTIAFLYEPLSIVEIAQLLEITVDQVINVLANLREIVDSNMVDLLPVTYRHASLLDFLTTESRSGSLPRPSSDLMIRETGLVGVTSYERTPLLGDHNINSGSLLYVPPSFHLKLSYQCFIVSMKGRTDIRGAARYGKRWCRSHSAQLLAAVSVEKVIVELEQVTRASSQTPLYPHLYTVILLSCGLFRARNHITPGDELKTLTTCMESLALALEIDDEPAKWVQNKFRHLGFGEFAMAEDLVLNLDQEQMAKLQDYLLWIATAIRMKVSLILLLSSIRSNP
jgi:hypothetical protein